MSIINMAVSAPSSKKSAFDLMISRVVATWLLQHGPVNDTMYDTRKLLFLAAPICSTLDVMPRIDGTAAASSSTLLLLLLLLGDASGCLRLLMVMMAGRGNSNMSVLVSLVRWAHLTLPLFFFQLPAMFSVRRNWYKNEIATTST